MATTLSANRIISNYATVGDYLIEWRNGSVTGTAVFRSGEGSDPLIQAIHPFTDELVQSGILYPVIQYIYFNGVKYTLVYDAENNYSPDLLRCLELDYVQIEGVNCSSGTEIGDYTHLWDYNNTQDVIYDASRTIRFDLNNDGSTAFLAWQFSGYFVYDIFRIDYYRSNGTLVQQIYLHMVLIALELNYG